MSDRRRLARRLSACEPFDEPRVDLEQYPTPAEIAAELVHTAALQGDLAGRTVVDLGTGTGVLALGAATRGPDRVIGVDRDRAALSIARENATRVDPESPVHWVQGDARRPGLRGPATVLSNPPFGAQAGAEHADREFLATAASIATVSYSIHNAGSESFVHSFVDDHGGRVTHAWETAFPIDRQFAFHEADRHEIDVEIYRIAWTD
ncbi:METTL5 family protein [Halococcoides cellulosivorans]|uniref:RNA methyltransferase n=1 Tax=Halococcoides cellulosivorans TaxID=1679096 RepID=A0A2R4X1G4_9EURY|nr:METTL5 family protein [Halococcoides cellulosivorans]AWB27631.1 RNA methyltransferase [Halococcoides cellulosivorans]